jgi:hypothetical protein
MSAAIATALISGSKRRRQVGGVNEAEAIEAFRNSRAHFDTREPDSRSTSSGSEGDSPPKLSRKKRRIAYSREKKLQAITYLTSTDMPKKGTLLGEMILLP